MFTKITFVHIHGNLILEGNVMAAARSEVVHKHFRLDVFKLKRAQRALEAATETEAVERALDLVLLEHERNRIVREANRKFLKSGAAIRDVYRSLDT